MSWAPNNFPVPYHVYFYNSLSFLELIWMTVSWNLMIKDLNSYDYLMLVSKKKKQTVTIILTF